MALFLPRKAGFSEVPVCGYLIVIHIEQTEALDDALRRQIVVLTYNLHFLDFCTKTSYVSQVKSLDSHISTFLI